MRRQLQKTARALALAVLLVPAVTLKARNEILGEVRLVATSKAERDAGVWIDGLYVGYVDELKGSRKILLLPGEHRITVRQIGYFAFERAVMVEPGQLTRVHVTMQRDERAKLPEETAEVRLSVWPRRAAVFVDDHYVGPVSSLGKAMLLAAGRHRIKIALPGFRTFETEVDLLPNQKFELKTALHYGSVQDAGPLIRADASAGPESAGQ